MTYASETFVKGTGNLDALPSSEPCTKPQVAPVSRPKPIVLVIDDDAVFSHLVSSILRKHEFNVFSASSVVKGLNMLTYGPGHVRVVVFDYNMPKFNGDETLKFVRQLNPSAKVLGVTALNLSNVPKTYLDGVDNCSPSRSSPPN